MPPPANTQQLRGIRQDVDALKIDVEEAVFIAFEAAKQVTQLRNESLARRSEPSPSGVFSEAALQERLGAFETYMIDRVREETARAAPSAHYPAATDLSHVDLSPTSLQNISCAPGRMLDLQLEAQRTRSATMEQRLGQLESRLNALMADVVAQSQREAAHQKQLASKVHECVVSEISAAEAARERALQPKAAATQPSASTPPSEVVDVPVMHHVAATLAAMHQRVEEQHAQFVRSQEENAALMTAIAEQMNGLKEENVSLRQQLRQLLSHRPVADDAANHREPDRDDVPVVWAKKCGKRETLEM